jgi:hypothetical protein
MRVKSLRYTLLRVPAVMVIALAWTSRKRHKTILVVEPEPCGRCKRGESLVVADRRRLERHAVVSAMCQAADALAAVAALTCPCRIVAPGKHHFVPKKGGWRECRCFFFVRVAGAVGYGRCC